MGASDARGIIDSCVREAGMIAKLRRSLLSSFFHLRLRTKVQAAGRAGFDAGGFEALAHAIHAERALENLTGTGTELGDVKRAPANAVAAADAVVLLEVHDAIRVLHDGAVCRASGKASRVFAMHALIFAHQQHQAAVLALMLVEFDQVPVVPGGFGHRLVGVIEGGLTERIPIPFQAGNLAGFAANASGRVDQLTNFELALDPSSGNRTGVS